MFIEKKMASWEINCGQIMLSGEKNIMVRDIFKNHFGRTFTLETDNGPIQNVNFLHKQMKSSVRLACSKYFKRLNVGDIIYLSVQDEDTIKISRKKPNGKSLAIADDNKVYSEEELKNLIIRLTIENQELRELVSELQEYKSQLDKYEGLGKIFKDEKFMEDWLERNIHKVVPDLEIVDRQLTVSWHDNKKIRFDLLCVDRVTRELVVIENKVKGRNRTVEEQILSYRAWISKNLDFVTDPANII